MLFLAALVGVSCSKCQPLLRRRSALTGMLVLLSSSFLLAACIVTADQSVEADPKDPRAQDLVDKIRGLDSSRGNLRMAGQPALASRDRRNLRSI